MFVWVFVTGANSGKKKPKQTSPISHATLPPIGLLTSTLEVWIRYALVYVTLVTSVTAYVLLLETVKATERGTGKLIEVKKANHVQSFFHKIHVL